MNPKEFRKIVQDAKRLTPHQRQVLMDRIQPVGQEQETAKLVETRVAEKPVCAHCGCGEVVRNGVVSWLQRYRCKGCGRCFNALTGTPMARLRHKDKWIDNTEAMIEGASVRKTAAKLGVHRTTAFRWRHKFLHVPRGLQAAVLAGIAEADETYILESKKGQRKDLGRDARKRGGKARKRGLSEEQTPVLICRDREGNTADFVLEKADKACISAALKPLLAKDAILCTDSGKALCAAARKMGITHRPVNLAAGRRVVAGVYHVQNVNAYDSRLKEWLRGFHGVATKYLRNYLGWRRLLERQGKALSPSGFLRAALG
jgi:transposase-like protein